MKKSIMVKSVLGWLTFITMVTLFSFGLIMSPMLKEVDAPEFDYGYIPLSAKLIPLIIASVALLVIIASIASKNRSKKILDCIGDRGTPDGGV